MAFLSQLTETVLSELAARIYPPKKGVEKRPQKPAFSGSPGHSAQLSKKQSFFGEGAELEVDYYSTGFSTSLLLFSA